jgi:hypothetical protein
MRALSIRQPFAEAIMRGHKTIEYRSQPTAIRERIYIYASLGRYPEDEEEDMLAEYGITDVASNDLPRGVLVGTVELFDCTGEWDESCEWHLRKPERLKKPLKPVHRANPVWFHPFGDDDAPVEQSESAKDEKPSRKPVAKATKRKSRRTLYCRGKDANATGEVVQDGFLVHNGSIAQLDIVPSAIDSVTSARRNLLKTGVLVKEYNHLRFAKAHLFSTPSGAAAVVMGRTANGFIEWKDSDGLKLKEILGRTK